MKFGDNLKALRKANNLSQEDLAEKMQVSRQSVSKWETSLSYPEMNNILQLCKILNCNIEDLLNDNIIDISSFDDDVKMNVVKLKKEEQQKIKLLSQIVEIISKVGRIMIIISIGIVFITMIAMPFIISRMEVNDNTISFKGHDDINIKINGDVVLEINDEKVIEKIDIDSIYKIKQIFDNNSKPLIILYVETGFVLLLVYLILVLKILKHLELLFKQIKNGDTPFTKTNVKHIKSMAYLMIVVTLLPEIIGLIFEFIMKVDLNVGFELFDIIEIMFLLSMAYIFQYGYEIQQDSKGKMYDNRIN